MGTIVEKSIQRLQTFERLLIVITITSLCFGMRDDYFQQHVAYDIEVTLDDSTHTLEAFEKIV